MKSIKELLLEVSGLTATVADLESKNTELTATVDRLTPLEAKVEEQEQAIATYKESISVLESGLDVNKQELADVTAERDALKASQEDFDGKVAAEVAKLGIRKAPVAQPKEGASADDIRERFASMPAGADRSKFYSEHRDVLGLGA